MPHEFQPGDSIGHGRFTLERELGRGGMGVVWLATDAHLDEQVALKFLPPQLVGDAEAVDGMRREVSKSRKLSHPNIVRIHDLILSADEPPFVTLEYIDGANMSDVKVAQENRLFSWEQIRPVVRQLCSALDYAHSQKVVHRDLKPGNMMLDREGHLKLADFGLAASLNESISRMTADLGSSGTPPYMSPQQIDGRVPKAADDIYALGATIYEFLTSKPPFYTGDIMHQVRTLAPQPMDERLADLELENDIPPAVAAMVMACLAKEREQRPPSARAVAEWIGLDTGDFVGAAPTHELESFVSAAKAEAAQPVASEAATLLDGISQEDWEDAFPEDAEARRPEGRRKWLVAVVLLLLLIVGGNVAKKRQMQRQRAREAKAKTEVSLAPAPMDADSPAEPEEAWVDLLQGGIFGHWQAPLGPMKLRNQWELLDGVLKTKDPGRRAPRIDLATREAYDDFELRLEFQAPPNGNSGIFYFAPDPAESTKVCPEFQIVDNDRTADGRDPMRQCGAVYNMLPASERLLGLAGKWNTLRLHVQGGAVTHEVNGIVLLRYDRDSDDWRRTVKRSQHSNTPAWNPTRPGYILLQHHGGNVQFRNIRIRRLD